MLSWWNFRNSVRTDIADDHAFEIGQTRWRERHDCKDKGGGKAGRKLQCDMDKCDGTRLKGGREGMRESSS